MKKVIVLSRCMWSMYNFRSSLICTLMNKNVNVLAAGSYDGEYENKLQAKGIKTAALPIGKKAINPIADIWLILSLCNLIRSTKPDLIHAFTIKPVLYAPLANFLCNRPSKVLITITGLGHTFISGSGWLKRIVIMLYKIACKLSDKIIFQNPDDLELFLKLGIVNKSKTSIIQGSGVDLNRFDKHKYTPLPNRPPQHTKFLMVSRLIREKGIYEFVDAAKSLKKNYPKCEFIVVGDRDTRNPSVVAQETLESWTTSGVIQWLDRTDSIEKVIADADIVVLPSYREGLPKSLLEAMALNKPIVTTYTTGCKEVLEENKNGFFAEVKNADSLASAMKKFIESPEIIDPMGEFSYQMVKERFSDEIVIQKTLEAYTSMSR